MPKNIEILKALEKKPIQFIDTLLSFDSSDLSKAIIMINEENINFCSIALNTIQEADNIFGVANLATKILTELKNICYQSLIDILIIFHEKAVNDYAAGIFYEPIKILGVRNNLKNFENKIVNNKITILYGYISTIYLGMAEIDFNNGYTKLLKMINSQDNALVQTGIKALGGLKVIPPDYFNEIKTILIRHSLIDAFAANAVYALCCLIKLDKDLIANIEVFSNTKNPEIIYHIANYIRSESENMDDRHLELLLNVCEYDLEYKGISLQFDLIISTLLDKEKYKEAYTILETWISFHSAQELSKNKFEEIFTYSSSGIGKKREFASKLITTCLNNDNQNFHIFLNTLCNYLSAYHIKNLEFSENNFPNNYIDFLYITRKILGYINDPEISINLFASILRIKKLAPDIEKSVSYIIINIFGYNQYNLTITTLSKLLDVQFQYPTKVKKKIRSIIETIDANKKQFEKLPMIQELLPNLDNQIKLNNSFQKSFASLAKDAFNSSLLIQSCNQIKIIAGDSWFSYYDEQFIEPTQLKRITHTIEIPLRVLIDDIGYAIENCNYRCAKRGDQ